MQQIVSRLHLLRDEPSARWVRLYLGFFFIVVALSQLVAFEAYPAVIASYYMPVVSDTSTLTAILVVFTEIAAVPVLLSMALTPRLRTASIVANGLILAYWLAVGLWQTITTEYIPNAGLFGAKILLPQGWWLVCFILAHVVLYGFLSLCHQAKK